MIIVTGGCGFIGANLIHKLNQNGIFDIIIVDKINKLKAPYLKKIKFTDFSESRFCPWIVEFDGGLRQGT